MHEYSIIQALVDRVAEEAQRRHASAVSRLHVSIGELSGVEIELLRTAYFTFRDGTVCSHADLTIDRIEAEWQCATCGRRLARGERLLCPSCGMPARLVRGDEILLDRIEMEVA